MLINAHYDSVSVVSTLTCRFTFICRFWVLLKVCRLIPSRTSTPTRTRAATKFCASRNHAGRIHSSFARAARQKKSEDFPILSRELGVKLNCMIPTLDILFFEYECNADSINSQRRCEVCAAQARRVHAFFGARDVPDFQKLNRNFAKFFTRILRKICVISTLDSRVLLY